MVDPVFHLLTFEIATLRSSHAERDHTLAEYITAALNQDGRNNGRYDFQNQFRSGISYLLWKSADELDRSMFGSCELVRDAAYLLRQAAVSVLGPAVATHDAGPHASPA